MHNAIYVLEAMHGLLAEPHRLKTADSQGQELRCFLGRHEAKIEGQQTVNY